MSVNGAAKDKLLESGRRPSFASSAVSSEFINGTNSNALPQVQRIKLWLRSPRNRHTMLFWFTLSSGVLQMGFKITDLIVFSCLDEREAPAKAPWIVFYGINILLLSLTLIIILMRRFYTRRMWLSIGGTAADDKGSINGHGGTEDKENQLKPWSVTTDRSIMEKRRLGFWGRVFVGFNMVSSTFVMVTSIVFLASTSSQILTLRSYSVLAAVVIGFEAADCAFSVIFLMLDMIYESMPFAMVAQAISIMASALTLLVSILCIWANQYGRVVDVLRNPGETPLDSDKLREIMNHSKAFPYFGIIIAMSSGVGLTAGLSLDAFNRLSDLGSTISLIHIVTTMVTEVICIVYFSMSCYNLKRYIHYNSLLRDIMIADPLIGFAGMALSVIGIVAMLKVRERPKTDLKVEEYNLSNLTSQQLEVWARLIDVYNKKGQNPDSAGGHEAVSLLKAYQESPMENMYCRVLRVYDAGAKAYESIRAWDKLDSNSVFEDDEASLLPDRKASFINKNADDMRNGAVQNLSKNAAKKAERKAAKKAAKKGNNTPASAVHQQLQLSPEEIKKDIQFRNDLIATEALVLLTCIDNYDLLSSISNTRLGKFAARLFGAHSPFKWTCIRMGLLATHWPFRQAMLFTSPTNKPNARAAAVCRAIADYNRMLPRSRQCTMILNPTVAHRGVERAIRPSGWAAVPLPPSHVVDLRPYQGASLQEYLKKIKYRDQAKNFQKAKGEVIETTDFSDENCEKAIELWWNIASKRTADGNTSVLVNPTAEFLGKLGRSSNEKGYRELLFLKVDGKVIASAVLFKLGDTITSDLQGLDHEMARKYNAYFVMMQETISIALKNGIKFVDFGPTTSQPKAAIGAKDVTITGGIYAKAPLSWAVPWFSGNVNVDN